MEAQGSPTESWARGECHATRKILVPWNQRQQAIAGFLGPRYAIGIIQGAPYPYSVGLNATDCLVTRTTTANGTQLAVLTIHYANPGRHSNLAPEPPTPTDAELTNDRPD